MSIRTIRIPYRGGWRRRRALTSAALRPPVSSPAPAPCRSSGIQIVLWTSKEVYETSHGGAETGMTSWLPATTDGRRLTSSIVISPSIHLSPRPLLLHASIFLARLLGHIEAYSIRQRADVTHPTVALCLIYRFDVCSFGRWISCSRALADGNLSAYFRPIVYCSCVVINLLSPSSLLMLWEVFIHFDCSVLDRIKLNDLRRLVDTAQPLWDSYKYPIEITRKFVNCGACKAP